MILIPVGLVSVISRTSPFWLAILGHFFIGELVTSLDIFGMVICFGVLVAITLGDTNTDEITVENNRSNFIRFLGIVLMFANSWTVAGIFVINRALKGVDSGILIFFHGFFGMITSLGYLLWDSVNSEDSLFFLRCSPNVYFYLLMQGLCDTMVVYAGLKAA